MANKSFVVQYLIKAKDKYSAAANRVAKSTRNMRARVKEATKTFSDFSAKTRKVGAILTAAVTAPILFMAKSLKDAARDAGETDSKFATVFRSISAKSEAAAKNLSKNYGLSQMASKQLLGDTGDLLSGFGFTQDAALDLSERVNTLAVDLASFTNFSGGAEGASAALTKALLGERESLKSLGIAISEKDVKAKIATLIASGQTFASLRQAKAQATLALAVDQSKNAIGDFARTSQDLANQERITDAAIQDLKVSMGKALLPAAMALTKAIRGVVEWMNNLSPQAKKIILIVGGVLAVLGPLLLLIGSLALVIPIITAGMAAFATIAGVIGTVLAVLLSPIGLIVGGLALGAVLIVKNWGKVKKFFSDFIEFIKSQLAPVIDKISGGIEKVMALRASIHDKVGSVADDLFGGGGVFDIFGSGKVDVGVNIGLAEGLEQTAAATVAGAGARRTDVGFATGG